jgi:hypothetical protein
MKRPGLMLIVAVLLAALLVACGQSDEQSVVEFERTVAESGEFYAEAPMAYDEAMSEELGIVTGAAVNAQPSGVERLIIRTGDISIVVADTEDGMARIAALAEGNGGWVVSSYVFQADEFAKSGTITVRVPAEGFQSVLDAISEMAIEVQSLSTSGQDVTEEYVDLDARLGNLEATAERVRGFLDEAETVEEALAVSSELSRLEGEIESIKGRMQYLSQSAAFSTITANLTPDALAQPVQIGGWQPVGVAKEALEALISGLQTLANILIWLAIYVLPIALLIGIPAYLIVRAVRNRRRTKTTTVPPESPATSD